ncbi:MULTISPECIES: GLPGLI family protein [unclassified Polaribacter]|jgi:GLPGLI family protein|uniref:GLPGLI family protein n=1 Tax=unclassified Polaribacter TaxID=196858 RepID=UPI0011BF74B2|nr:MULTISPECIES: GLPGLI family protein [unclassified Polaribacter]TXD48507.1 GLPGLI family protein [Polaribacter sp. IC063]TXD55851.1 GLPGLI family protein [Polaribacter sp. IC066]
MKFVILFLFPIIAFSQEKDVLITYKAIYNTELPTVKNGYLVISANQKETVYYTEIIKNRDNEVENDENIDATVKLNSGKNQYNYYDYNKDTLITRNDVFKQSKLVKEKIPNFNWVLSKEQKSINETILYKATCYFRGRNYIAWYSPTIAIKSGPWKFQGLPGLIYEIYDETRRYNWLLQEVKSTNYDFNSIYLDLKSQEVITIQEYADLKFNNNDWDKKLLTKLPRGAKIVNQKNFRTGFEIKFEWEEEEVTKKD